MNSTVQRLRIASVNLVKEPEGKISASGTCQFKFYNSGEYQGASASYQAFGQAALRLQEAVQQGNGSAVVVVKGSIDILPPDAQNVNHRLILKISHVLSVEASGSSAPAMGVSVLNFNNGSEPAAEISLDELPC